MTIGNQRILLTSSDITGSLGGWSGGDCHCLSNCLDLTLSSHTFKIRIWKRTMTKLRSEIIQRYMLTLNRKHTPLLPQTSGNWGKVGAAWAVKEEIARTRKVTQIFRANITNVLRGGEDWNEWEARPLKLKTVLGRSLKSKCGKRHQCRAWRDLEPKTQKNEGRR